MRIPGGSIKEKIMAWILALAMILGSFGSQGSLVFAAAGDDITVTVNITEEGTQTPVDGAKVTFTAEGENPVEIMSGESGILKEGTAYTYEISANNYETKSGEKTFSSETGSEEPATAAFTESLKKMVKITFQPMSDGKPVTGIELLVNDKVLKENENGELTMSLGKGTQYSAKVKNALEAGYDEAVSWEVKKSAEEETIVINMGPQYADVTVKVKNGDKELDGASVSYSEGTSGGVGTNLDPSGVRLIVGKTYEFTATKKGYENASEVLIVKEKDNSITLNMNVADPVISAEKTTITYPDKTTWTVEKGIDKEDGYHYKWSSGNTDVAEVNESTGEITPKKGGTADISVSIVDAGENVVKTASKPLTVNKGSTDHPEISIENESDVDQTDVKFKLENLKEGGALEIVASGDCLKDNQKDRTFSIEVSEGQSEVTISLQDSIKTDVKLLQGNVAFKLKYTSGGYNYTPETKDLNKAFYRTKELNVQLQNGTSLIGDNTLTYGDDGEFKIGVKEDGVEGSSLTYDEVETVKEKTEEANREKEILAVDRNGNITIKNAGTAKITVTRERYHDDSDYTTYWDAYTADITITVNPKKLDPIGAVTYTQDTEDRIYKPGDKSVKATGVISVESAEVPGGLEAADVGKIIIAAEEMILDSADAGTYEASKIKISSYRLAEGTEGTDEAKESALVNYQLPEAEKLEKLRNITSEFEIKPKELTITVGNASVPYQEIYNKSIKPEATISINEKAYDEEQIGKIENNLTLESVDGTDIEVNTHKGIICVNLDIANENAIEQNQRGSKNYKFSNTGHTWGDLTVVKEELQQSKLNEYISYGGDFVVYGTDLVWVKAEGGKLTLAPQGEYAERYNAVVMANAEGKPLNPTVDLTAGGISSEELSKLQGLSICLAKKGDDGVYKNFSSSLNVPFKLDAAAPTTVFDTPMITERVTAAGEQMKNISFGLFSNVVYLAEFTVTDMAGTQQAAGQADIPGAGTKSVRTSVWKLAEGDLTDGAVNEKRIREIISEIQDWKDEELKPDGRYSVEVARDREGKTDAIAGSYLVLAEVTDQVGNTQVYASNGIVVDLTMPSIQVTFDNGGVYVDNPKEFYDGDISYAISVMEGGGLGVSGVAEVTWEVRCNGNVVKECSGSGKITDINNGVPAFEEGTVQAYKPGIESDEFLQFTKEELTKVFAANHTIDAGKCNSNNLLLTVKAKDRAGNIAAEKSYNLCIDTTDPVVSVSYDNNSVKNGKYFKKGRVATITFKERNFNRSGVTFDLTLEDGTKYERVSLETLKTIKGMSADWGRDFAGADGMTQKDKAAGYTDGRINVARIYFLGDNTYKGFQVHCTDIVGRTNKGVSYDNKQAAPTDFVIDQTAPFPTIHYFADGQEIWPGKSEDERLYKNKVVTAVIQVDEHNFALNNGFVDGQVVYEVSGTKVEEGQKLSDYQKQAKGIGNWTSNGDLRMADTFEYAVDANYKARFHYTDLAGNSCELSRDFFTVDRTAPTGTITVGKFGIWNRFLSNITFGLFGSESQKVSLTGDDHTSPVTSVAYNTSYEPMDKVGVAAMEGWKNGKSFRMDANKQFIVYSRITDKAGNITYLSSNGVILDSTKPGPSITITAAKPSHGVYAGNVPFTIQVEDPAKGNTYAGLKSVSYEILNSGKVTQSGDFNDSLKPASKRVKRIKKNLSVNSRLNNSNDVMIRVTAVDNAGNTSSKEEKLKIDVTKPEISVSYNINSPLNGKFYKDNRVATVTIRERNFDPNNVRFTISNTDGTRPAISGWSNSANSGVSDQATHTCTVSFASDGDYTFTLECTDLAGNQAAYGKTDTFTIDKTVPKISVSYDNNAVSGGHYYMAERTATVTVTEHNFNAADVRESITASLNGQGIPSPVLSGFSNSGDTHTATVHFADNGDYTLQIAYTDMAGNPAEAYEGDRFTVDLEKPVIKISGIEKANKGAVNPVIEVTDNNYDASKVTITLKGTKHKAEDKDGSHSSVTLGERIRLADLPHKEDVDDIYTLTVHAADQAGNTQEESFTFSVNRFGSVYTMDEATEKMLEKYYAGEEDLTDLTVSETNTDSLKHQKITCSKDGEIYELKEGKDYLLEESGNAGNWKVYTYQILKENFSKDGKYIVTIYSEDEAKNSSSNQGKNKQIEFVVDRTMPTIVVTGIENGKRYRENTHDVTIDAKDNIYLKSLRVEIQEDGVSEPSVYEFTEEELEKGYGVVTQAIKSAGNWQTLKAIAEDAAGNKGESEMFRVLVTSNLWIQFYMNKPLFFGSILLFLLLLALIAYLVRRRGQAA